MRSGRLVGALLAVTVALVLADSAVVTLALPDILSHLEATVTEVAWVLIAFNLVLGLLAVPAALLASRWPPGALGAAGISVFAAASAWCAVADSVEVLITARCLQAVGGALALVGCLELLVGEYGQRRGQARWVASGVVGTASGPVVGGLLTEAISWQAIFVVQVPLAALAVPAALRARRPDTAEPDRRRRPDVGANLTLALLSAALTAALFLLVLLLVEGWQRSPAVAALTVSVVPIAALLATPLARLARIGPRAEVVAGCLLVAGGLVGLALPPSAHLAWTIAPQALVGLGLGLTVDRLTTRALADRAPRALHAGWSIGARHLGVVLGLAVLTPVFTADLRDAEPPARQAIAAAVIDAPLLPETRIDVAEALGRELSGERGRVPDLSPAFADLDVDVADRRAVARLEVDLDEQVERAATRAFRDSFLVGAGFALLALIGVAIGGRVRSRRDIGSPAAALALTAVVLGVQAAAGGGRFSPTTPADPCLERVVTSRADGIDALAERLVLLGVDGAACRLGVTRETLILDLARGSDPSADQIEALHQGLRDAVRRMADDGTLPPSSALVGDALDAVELNRFLEAAVRAVPDDAVDAALPSDEVLTRAIDGLDLCAVLADLDDPAALDARVQDAVTEAARDTLLDRLRDLF